MIKIRPSEERGKSDIGWLQANFTFSFADYFDREHLGFHDLRVLNQDIIQPDNGFDTHFHKDMEILTYVLDGEITHADSMGHESSIGPGELQLISAGTGITHSEHNRSSENPVHSLQIWIKPNSRSIEPKYDQKDFKINERLSELVLVASQKGSDGSLQINQDAFVYVSKLEAGNQLNYEIADIRHAWLHVATGAVTLNGVELSAGDGAALSNESNIDIVSSKEADLVLFDLN